MDQRVDAGDRRVDRVRLDAVAGTAGMFNPLPDVDLGKVGRKAKAFAGEDIAKGADELIKGVQRFFSGGTSSMSSLGTFNAGAVASLQVGNVDQQMLSVLQKQLGVQERMERKDGGWGAT